MVTVRYAILLHLLVACSDGDDSGTGTPPGGNSFAVTAVAPANGATDVEINASVTASFSEAVASSTLNAESFALKQGAEPVPAAVAYDDGSRLARLTAPLLPGITYQATVTTAVQTGDGTPLDAPKEWSFGTRAWPSITLDNGAPSGLSLILDASGTLHLAYAVWPDLKYATCSASCSLVASWRSVTIDQGEWPSLAIDGAGRLHMTYEASGKAVYATCTASCLDSSNWDIVAIDEGSTLGEGPSVKADDDGRVHVSYADIVSGDIKYATCASECASQSQWETAVVADLDVVHYLTSIAVESSGRVHITFEDIGELASHTHLAYATCASDCTTAANWEWITVDPGNLTGAVNSLVVDGNGRAHVAYSSGGDFQIHYATCGADCTTAANWQIVGIPTILGGSAPSLAVDRTGRVHISYNQYINFSDSELRYATCAAGCTDFANWQTVLLYPGVVIRTSILVDGTGRVRLSHDGGVTVNYEE
ncbi:MAG: Ig-like domain-containing protein [Gemmatimonadales bacterium]